MSGARTAWRYGISVWMLWPSEDAKEKFPFLSTFKITYKFEGTQAALYHRMKGSRNSGWSLTGWACKRMDTFGKTKSNLHEVLPRQPPRMLWTRVSLRKTAYNPYCSLQVVLNQLSVKLPTSSIHPCSRLSKSTHKVSHQGQSMSITSGCPSYSCGGMVLHPALHTAPKLVFPSRKATAKLPEGSPGSREDLLPQGLTQGHSIQ